MIRPPVEMSADQRFGRRVVRLALTSVVALGVIFALSSASGPSNPLIGEALAAGWVLMPALLLLSLHRPALRYSVAVPAAMVSLALLAICIEPPSASPVAQIGWLLVCIGVLLGGLIGAWFWFRLLPAPASLDDPFAPGRWVLIAIHVAAIVLGLTLVGASLLI